MRPVRRELKVLCPAAKLDAQLQRYRAAECGFAEYFGTLESDHRFFSAPARTEICGNQTAHNNGKVFAASVDADTIAVARPTGDGFITVKREGFPEDKIDINDLDPKDDEKNTTAALIRGIARGFKKNAHQIGGFQAYVTSLINERFCLGETAAFEVLVGTIMSHLFNEGQIPPVKVAQIANYSENVYFGKNSGLTDQVACAVGGFVAIDFKDSDTPIIEGVPCNFEEFEHALCIVDVNSGDADMTEEYDSIRNEMKAVAGFFDCETLRSLASADIVLNINELRREFGDRAVMRAIHFFSENDRVERVVHALKRGSFEDFLHSVSESGNSSFKYLQNVYSVSDLRHQCLSIALNIAESTLHRKGACRLHGSGYTGTIQAFVPFDALNQFKMNMERVFGIGSCKVLTVRPVGGCEVLL